MTVVRQLKEAGKRAVGPEASGGLRWTLEQKIAHVPDAKPPGFGSGTSPMYIRAAF